MNKPSIWTAIALFIVCVASIAYAVAVTCAERDPPAEVKIIHEYTEGYFNGYRTGKYYALGESDEFGSIG